LIFRQSVAIAVIVAIIDLGDESQIISDMVQDFLICVGKNCFIFQLHNLMSKVLIFCIMCKLKTQAGRQELKSASGVCQQKWLRMGFEPMSVPTRDICTCE